MISQGELSILGFERVDVNGSIGGLCSDEFVQRIPRDALDVVVVLGDLSDGLPCGVVRFDRAT